MIVPTAGDRLWIWKHPTPDRKYLISADVARGDGSDFSAFHILDIETCEQVAEFKGTIDTREYANLLIKYGFLYHTAMLAVENASIGWDVVQTIYRSGYPNMYKSLQSDTKHNNLKEKFVIPDKKLIPGFTTSNSTRPILINKLEIYTENNYCIFHSERLYAELQTFKWINRKAQAQPGSNDDLVMSFSMGLHIRDSEYSSIVKNSAYTKSSLSAFNNNSHTPSGFSTNVYNGKYKPPTYSDGSPLNTNDWI